MGTMIVTGGAGFIGCNLVRMALSRTGDHVVVFDKLTYAGNRESLADVASHPRFAFVKGDIADREAVRALFREVRPTALLNLAAESHVDRSIDAPGAFIRTNIHGTYELLEASRAFLALADERARRAFRFLHVSTDEVYGSLGPSGAFSEATPYAPNSPYAASKAAADHVVRAWRETYGLPTLITNCSNNYGPYQFPEKLIPVVIQSVLARKPVPVYGDGMNVRDWLYVRDHAEALWLVLTRGRIGETYNIGGRNEWANLNIVQVICDLVDEMAPQLGGGSRKLITFVKDRLGHDRRYAIDASKIEKELGWLPAHRFEQGIRETVRWYLDNQEWVRSVLRH